MRRRGGPWVSVSSLPQSKSGTSPAPGANFCLCLSCLPMNWGPDAGLTACTSRCRNRLSGSRDSASGRPCTLGPPRPAGGAAGPLARSGRRPGGTRAVGPSLEPGEGLAASARCSEREAGRRHRAAARGRGRSSGTPAPLPACFKHSAQPRRDAPAGGRTQA